LAIFEPAGPNRWQPTALAAGPFAGLQGGAVASLLTAEVEALAEKRKWGTAISSSAWFLRPTPMTVLRTGLSVVTEGGRVSVVDNTLWPDGEDQPCATVRVTLSRERAVDIPGFTEPAGEAADPTRFPVRTRRAAHGRPWFMDAMEARGGEEGRARVVRLHLGPDPLQPVEHGAPERAHALGIGCHEPQRRAARHRLAQAHPAHDPVSLSRRRHLPHHLLPAGLGRNRRGLREERTAVAQGGKQLEAGVEDTYDHRANTCSHPIRQTANLRAPDSRGLTP